MNIYDEPKIDCHNHVIDPARFPYAADTAYRPAGQEIGNAPYFMHVLDAYGVRYALVVGPNSGYGTDNRCLLDAIARSGGRFKGIAVVPNDVEISALERLKAAGVIGVAFNTTVNGVAYYAETDELLARLAALGLFVQIQVEHDQLVPLAPMLERSHARILVDHCGRPTPEEGLDQPGFKALLGLARTGRAFVKLSGYEKVSREPYRCPPLCSCPDRSVHPGRLRLGIRLAFFEGEQTHRLRTAAEAGANAGSGKGRPPQASVGDATEAFRFWSMMRHSCRDHALQPR
jgi:predicted TIM-barrel fold metal-dependent hydrolase